MNKKVLVIGLGSMGKRRIRCLKALGVVHIAGFDVREDRCREVEEVYNIPTFKSFEEALSKDAFNIFIISVPPDRHNLYIWEAIRSGIPAFIEASVLDDDFDRIINQSSEKEVLLAPSCTLMFHPAIRKIQHIIDSDRLGKISNVIYHSGQYLPDWHTYENVSEYYVSNKDTGGAREIVPFELSWITKVFGFPKKIAGMYKKTISIEGAEMIDDTYSALFDYGNHLFFLTVDVVSRFATRRLTINGENSQLYWDWDESIIKIYDSEKSSWEIIRYDSQEAQTGYNKNITEEMYIDEIRCFLDAAMNTAPFINNMEYDRRVLKILYNIEYSSDNNRFIAV